MRKLALFAIGTVLVATGLSVAGRAHAQDPAPTPILVGHGASVTFAPENSVPALQGYGEMGVTVFEVDLQWAKNDPGPSGMASHDADLAAKTTCTGTVAANWFGTLRNCSAADYAPWNTDVRYAGTNPNGTPKVPIMYVYEMMAVATQYNATLLLDVKTQPTQTQMANFLDYAARPEFNVAGKTPMADRIIWMANSPENLAQARGWFPAVRYWLLRNESSTTMMTCAGLEGAQGYAVQNYRIDPAKVAYWHSCAPGFAVATWTTNSPSYDVPAEWERVRDAGVDYVITNRPEVASPVLFPPQVDPTPTPTESEPVLQLKE